MTLYAPGDVLLESREPVDVVVTTNTLTDDRVVKSATAALYGSPVNTLHAFCGASVEQVKATGPVPIAALRSNADDAAFPASSAMGDILRAVGGLNAAGLYART